MASHKQLLNDNIHNGPILTEFVTLKNIVCSKAEAECGGLFHNCQKAIVVRKILSSLYHNQLPTTVKTDNSAANYFVHGTMRLKKFQNMGYEVELFVTENSSKCVKNSVGGR